MLKASCKVKCVIITVILYYFLTLFWCKVNEPEEGIEEIWSRYEADSLLIYINIYYILIIIIIYNIYKSTNTLITATVDMELQSYLNLLEVEHQNKVFVTDVFIK